MPPKKTTKSAKPEATAAKTANATEQTAPALTYPLSVPPRPLPAPATGDALVDDLARALGGGGPASLEAANKFEKEAKSLSGAALAALLTDDVLDLGTLIWDEAVDRKLPTQERRTYRAAHTRKRRPRPANAMRGCAPSCARRPRMTKAPRGSARFPRAMPFRGPFAKSPRARCSIGGLTMTRASKRSGSPAIRFVATRSTDAEIPVGTTKLGGCPDLPVGLEWPHEGKQVFSFIAQFRLEELAAFDRDRTLPDKGLLSFFIQDEFDEPDEFLGAVKVLLSHGPLERCSVPEGFDRRSEDHSIREPFPACTLRAQPRLLIPAPSHPLVAASIPASMLATYEESVYLDPPSEHQLLGYRSISYQGEEDIDTVLQCISDDEAGMEWGDVQDLSFMMPRAALAARDFTQVVSVTGE